MPKREVGMSLFRLVMEFKQKVHEMKTEHDPTPPFPINRNSFRLGFEQM